MEIDYEDWSFEIREMLKKDLDEVREIHYLLFPVLYSESVFQEFLSEKYISLVIEATRKTEDDQNEHRIIGVATAERNWVSKFSLKRSGYLATFGILPGFRQHRLGTILLDTITECLRVYYSCVFIDLHMLADNIVALNFYENCEYVVCNKIMQYYFFFNKRHDALYLKRDLDNFEYNRPENIKISPTVEFWMNNKQKIGWFTRFCMEP